MRAEIGEVLIDNVDGNTVRRWFRVWSSNGQHVPKAVLILKVLKAALTFAVTCRKPGCAELLQIVRETMRKLPGLKRREAYITFPAVIELRKAAHQLGH